MKQEQSKESLFNELVSTFDYSDSKNNRNMHQLKKNLNSNQANLNNQTNSTMSLFSFNNPNIHDRQNSKSKLANKESKIKDEKYSKDKLEFQKINRKYSPEIDLQRALISASIKKTSEGMNQAKLMN